MEGNYAVAIGDFAQKHFIKSFQKKYQGGWEITLRAIIAELERIDMLLKTDRAETISVAGETKIIKTKFKIAGTKESAKTSGNRCIVRVDEAKRAVAVLLVYGKTDISGKNETAAWKSLIKTHYGIVCA